MCGIFGMVRSTSAAHPERASAAFVELGRLSVERGRDSAGFALANPDWDGAVRTAGLADVEASEVVINGVTIVKDTRAFGDMWDDETHLPLLADHRIALGHTRFATQGNRDATINASPLLVGTLVGTHNGDVDTFTVRDKFALRKPFGGTDTETLYLALDRDRRDRRKVTNTLTHVEGRAALAWLDRDRPNRVYLSRAALSPVSMAYDAEGNLYWASNPRWFRDIDAMFDNLIGFHTVTMIAEGSLLTIDATGEPVVEDVRRFKPTCRASDDRLSDRVIWRGFQDGDITFDKAQANHTVAKPLYAYSSGKKSSGSPARTKANSKAATSVESVKVGGSVVDDPWFMDAFDTNVEANADIFGDRWLQDDYGNSPEEAEAMDTEYAHEAYTRWIEEGEEPALLSVLRGASLPSEREQIMDEYDLPSPAALTMFRDLVDHHLNAADRQPA